MILGTVSAVVPWKSQTRSRLLVPLEAHASIALLPSRESTVWRFTAKDCHRLRFWMRSTLTTWTDGDKVCMNHDTAVCFSGPSGRGNSWATNGSLSSDHVL